MKKEKVNIRRQNVKKGGGRALRVEEEENCGRKRKEKKLQFCLCRGTGGKVVGGVWE